MTGEKIMANFLQPLPSYSRRGLDRMGCTNPDCDHGDHSVLFFHAPCHPEAGTWTSYDKRAGRLTLECKECGRPFMGIRVADGEVPEPADGALN
jgi:hypothetical protein